MTPEGRVKAAVRAYLKENDIWFYQPVQNGMGRVGIPDFICCWKGRFVAIETKAPGEIRSVTPNQRRVLEEILAHDGYTLVVDSVEGLASAFRSWQVAEILIGGSDAEVVPTQARVPEGLQRAARGSGQAGQKQRRAA